MSTQSYYKDRLGFDPKEVYDGPSHEKYMKIGTNPKQPQGYEENLTKFKGTTVWDFFIEAKGMVVGSRFFSF